MRTDAGRKLSRRYCTTVDENIETDHRPLLDFTCYVMSGKVATTCHAIDILSTFFFNFFFYHHRYNAMSMKPRHEIHIPFELITTSALVFEQDCGGYRISTNISRWTVGQILYKHLKYTEGGPREPGNIIETPSTSDINYN